MEEKPVEEKVKKAVKTLKALSNERRLMIICALHNQDNGELSVGALEEMIGLSQSALSQHLARLRRDGFVKTRRDAQTIYYSLNSNDVQQILETLHNMYCPETKHFGNAED